jgi:hypothetical protein
MHQMCKIHGSSRWQKKTQLTRPPLCHHLYCCFRQQSDGRINAGWCITGGNHSHAKKGNPITYVRSHMPEVPFRRVEEHRRKLKSRGHDWLKVCFCSIDHSYIWNHGVFFARHSYNRGQCLTPDFGGTVRLWSRL